MKTINGILNDYTAGKLTAQEANADLRRHCAGFQLEPGRNELTEADKQATVVGYYPHQANGYGLLFTGVGAPEKVRVRNGALEHAVNEVLPDGSTNGYMEVKILGRVYEVKGNLLVDK